MDATAAEQFGSRLLQAAQVVEEKVDEELHKMDNLDEDELEKLRQKRMNELKQMQKTKVEMKALGHGTYTEVADEREFFNATKKSPKVVCHFFEPSNEQCKHLDQTLQQLAEKYFGTKFIKINAPRAQFLVKRLNIRVIPTIAIIVNGKTNGYIRGNMNSATYQVDDSLSLESLEERLSNADAIKREAASLPKPKNECNLQIIRGKEREHSDDDDW